MTVESTRSRRKEKRVPSKLCVRCGKVKPLNEFYGNKNWASQSFHDAWCRDVRDETLRGQRDLAGLLLVQ